MSKKPRDRRFYQARAHVARALAHPSRLMILEALNRRECCVSELTDLVRADQSTVSKHLAVLRNAGLVEDRKQGTLSYYRLRCPCVLQIFDCVETVLRQNLEAQAATLAR
jgi:ArsR family transcriptional regulator